MIPHFDKMKEIYARMPNGPVKTQCADVISVLAMTMSDKRECLYMKLQGKLSTEEIELWGHEYVRHLAGEVVQEYNNLTEEQDEMKNKLISVASLIVPSQMKHHAEAEACDLMMEVEQLDSLQEYVDEAAYN